MSDGVERGTSERPSEQEDAVSAPPLLKVVNPDATPEEIAALVAVFSALGSADTEAPKAKPSEWSANHRRMRVNYSHGTGGWRSSGFPR